MGLESSIPGSEPRLTTFFRHMSALERHSPFPCQLETLCVAHRKAPPLCMVDD